MDRLFAQFLSHDQQHLPHTLHHQLSYLRCLAKEEKLIAGHAEGRLDFHFKETISWNIKTFKNRTITV